jgi:bifunctional DNase/RNase
MIEMTLVGVRVELPGNQPIVLLKEREGERYLPIWIGTSEAIAIAVRLGVPIFAHEDVLTEASIVIREDEEQEEEVEKFREFLDQVRPEDFMGEEGEETPPEEPGR